MFYCELLSGIWIGDIDILSNKKFIGLFELNQTFDLQSSEYLRYYLSIQ